MSETKNHERTHMKAWPKVLIAMLVALLVGYGLWVTRYDVLTCDFPNCVARDVWTGEIVLIRPGEIRRR